MYYSQLSSRGERTVLALAYSSHGTRSLHFVRVVKLCLVQSRARSEIRMERRKRGRMDDAVSRGCRRRRTDGDTLSLPLYVCMPLPFKSC